MKKLLLLGFIGITTFTLSACVTFENTDHSETAKSSEITKDSEGKEQQEKDMLDDYITYAQSVALPTENIDSVTLDGDTLTFIFDYNGQFGEFMKTLRKSNAVDERLKTYFKDNNVKTVELKTEAGNILLSSDYDVKFKLK